MSTSPLVILHAPSHGPTLTRRAIHHALSLGADSIGYTEAYDRTPWLSTRPFYRITVGHSTTDAHRGAKDNPILTRRRLRLLKHWAYKACGPSEPRKIAPERWTTGVVYRHPLGEVEHIAVHPNAAIQGVASSNDRVQKAARQMELLEQDIKRIEKSGHLGIVTGDMNFRHVVGKAAADIPDWAPQKVFERNGWDYINVGLDWIGYCPRLKVAETPKEIPPKDNGQDHPWILARFVLR